MTAEGSHTTPSDIDLVKILHVFRSRERWESVKILEEHWNRPPNECSKLPVNELATTLVDRLNEDYPHAPHSQVSLETALIETHLPILEDYGLVEYDTQATEVVPTESTTAFALLLRGIEFGSSAGEL